MTREIEELDNYLPYLRRYARALCGDAALGDSLADKTLNCARSLLQFVPADMEIPVWLYSVMHNLTGDFFTELYGDLSELEHLPYGTSERLTKDDPAELDVESAITLLTLEQREIFLLVTVEGLDYSQVGIVLGINRARLISCLHSARKLMSNYLFSPSNDQQAPTENSNKKAQ